jgi:hypothetical protein
MDLLDGSLVDDLGDSEISESTMELEGSSVDKSNKLKKKTNLRAPLWKTWASLRQNLMVP